MSRFMVHQYGRKVNYYETDQMGVVHHSNYIRWMEETRVAYLEKIGVGYDKMEADDVISPVLSVNCDFKKPLKFGEEFSIDLYVTLFDGIRLQFEYEIKRDGEICVLGKSSHCFVDRKFRPMHLKKSAKKYYDIFIESLETKGDDVWN